jgi:hypothetical protein
MLRTSVLLMVILTTAGCSSTGGLLQSDFGSELSGPLEFDKTYAEKQAGYSYIPVEPSTVRIECINIPCNPPSKTTILDALPDNSVRIATRLVSGKAGANIPVFGSDIGTEGNTYEVIIDFVNTQTVNKRFLGKWYITLPDTIKDFSRCYPFEQSVLEIAPLQKYENWTLRAELLKKEDVYSTRATEFGNSEKARPEFRDVRRRCPNGQKAEFKYDDIQISPEVFHVPVYVGIGLRLRANVTVLSGKVNLSSLPALTAAVSAGKATGTMSVQTIGISGKAARSNLLLLDKIDTTTIQNAIQVLASIKASIESGDTTITPRIVGFHNTIGAGSQGVNLIHSLLASDSNSYLLVERNSFAKGATDEATTPANGNR